MQTLVEVIPVGAVITDGAGKILITNEVGRAILGSPVSGSIESPERSYTPLYPDGSPLPAEDMPLAHALRGGQVIRDFEVLIRRAGGEERTILTSAAPIQHDTGKIVSAIAVFQDISDWKQAQKSLQIYANRLQALHETDQAILAARSVQEIVTAALRYAPHLLGCARSSITLFDQKARKLSVLVVQANGQTEVHAGRHGPWVDDAMVDALGQGKAYIVEQIESRASSPLLAEVWAEGIRACAIVPIFVDDELSGSLNLGMDRPGPLTPARMEIAQELANQVALAIQQARLREELRRHAGELEQRVARRTAALQASEGRFRTIFEDSIIGIAQLDAAGQILASNPALQTMLGYGEDELQGTSLNDYSHPDDAETHQELYQSLVAAELAYYQVQKRYIRKDGAIRWMALTLSGVKHIIKSEPTVAIAMVEDVTEKRRSEQMLLRAERIAIAGRLAPSLAHEINNPLQAVIGCLGLVEEMLDDGDEARGYLEIAMEELERAAGIVTQLRDLGRSPESSKKEHADLNAILEKVVTLTRKRWAWICILAARLKSWTPHASALPTTRGMCTPTRSCCWPLEDALAICPLTMIPAMSSTTAR